MADTSIGALCPITSMAPVLAITGMVARTTSFDPVGEISKPFVTGPNRVPTFRPGEKGCEPKQAQKQVEERRKNLPVVCDLRTRGWRLFIRMRRGSTSEMRVTT